MYAEDPLQEVCHCWRQQRLYFGNFFRLENSPIAIHLSPSTEHTRGASIQV